MPGSGEAVVRIEAEFVKNSLIAEPGFPFRALPSSPENSAEGLTGGGGGVAIDIALEQGGLPIGGFSGRGFHRVDTIGPVNKVNAWHRAGRQQGSEGVHGVGLPEGPVRTGTPIGFDAEFFEGLFANDPAGRRFGKQDGIGDTAAERADGGIRKTGLAEVAGRIF